MMETNLENKSMAWCKPKEVFKPNGSCVGMKENSLKTLIFILDTYPNPKSPMKTTCKINYKEISV
jgi:hypothetical protein